MKKPSENILYVISHHEIAKRSLKAGLSFGVAVVNGVVGFIFFKESLMTLLGYCLINMFVGFVLYHVVMNRYYNFLVTKKYGTDIESFVKDAQYATKYFASQNDMLDSPDEVSAEDRGKIEIIITETSDTIGVFQDAKIFEWIKIKLTDGSSAKFDFHSTTNDVANCVIDGQSLIIHPGIIYRLSQLSSD